MTASLLGFAVLGGLLAVVRLVTRPDAEAPGTDTPPAGSAS